MRHPVDGDRVGDSFVRLESRGGVWHAEVEARGLDHVKVPRIECRRIGVERVRGIADECRHIREAAVGAENARMSECSDVADSLGAHDADTEALG
jgi:hypothetical protein